MGSEVAVDTMITHSESLGQVVLRSVSEYTLSQHNATEEADASSDGVVRTTLLILAIRWLIERNGPPISQSHLRSSSQKPRTNRKPLKIRHLMTQQNPPSPRPNQTPHKLQTPQPSNSIPTQKPLRPSILPILFHMKQIPRHDNSP